MSAMATSPLLSMTNAAHDTGSAEGITTERRDFLWVDDSIAAKESVSIRGPSVGTPGCVARGPLIYRLKGERKGLCMPDGILAESGDALPTFRLVPAQQLKKRGVRIIGGKFEATDKAECVRTGDNFTAVTRDDILVIETLGFACDLVGSPH